MSNEKKQTLGFQTEVKQILQLMIHSLYSNSEIFLRELISNAADAADKLRYLALASPDLYENNAELSVKIELDPTLKQITICDNGIGMTQEEVIANLGTIAKSGTKEFLAAMQEGKNATQLIGQFGVGFYSSFIVADKVTVITRKAGMPPDAGVRWESNGDGEFTVEETIKVNRGTDIILHLKEESAEFLDEWRLKNIVRKYSDHTPLPVVMKKKDKDGKEEDEVINKATALWTLPKNEIKDEEYKEFYKYIAHDFEDPLAWVHNKVEGKQEYTNLLYLPARAPFDLYHRERHQGLKLYVKRVFIMDDVEQFLPFYLRFIKGVLDANDLPLNVSREILQHNKQVEAIKSALTKRVLSLLEKMASDDKENYAKFWAQFGTVLKEGPAEDANNREQIAKLLRFSSTDKDEAIATVSLDDYISRMKEKQSHIYYITADSFLAAKNSPQLEIFRSKGIEVLLLSERIDEWLVTHLTEYQGKQLRSVAKGRLDLDEIENNEEVKKEQEKAEKTFSDLLKEVKSALGDRVKEVRVTHRLTHSPACVVLEESDMNPQMQRILQAAGQSIPQAKPILELNPEHPLLIRLNTLLNDKEKVQEWSSLLLGQAILAEGGHLDNPAEFVQQMNKLLM